MIATSPPATPLFRENTLNITLLRKPLRMFTHSRAQIMCEAHQGSAKMSASGFIWDLFGSQLNLKDPEGTMKKLPTAHLSEKYRARDLCWACWRSAKWAWDLSEAKAYKNRRCTWTNNPNLERKTPFVETMQFTGLMARPVGIIIGDTFLWTYRGIFMDCLSTWISQYLPCKGYTWQPDMPSYIPALLIISCAAYLMTNLFLCFHWRSRFTLPWFN